MPESEPIDVQLQHVAKLLVEARAPLIYGLTQLTVEAQELAVELAMCLRGAIDTPRGHRIPARGTSLQLHGEARTTLGELKQYVDVLIFVGCAATPELRSLFAVDGTPALPAKKVYVLQSSSNKTHRLETQVRELGCRNKDEVLALRKKLKVTTSTDPEYGQLLAAWQNAKYPVLIYEPAKLLKTFGKNAASYLIEQLERAAIERAKFGRAAAWPFDADPGELSNATGAEYVLTARTGYPAAVQCFSGCAEFLPGVTNAEALLADGVVDAALFLGEGTCNEWSAAAQQHLQEIPTAMVASQKVLQGQNSKHQIACCNLSEEQGTIVREDGVPLHLAAKVPPQASTEKILRQLLALVREPTVASPGAAR